MPLKKLLNLHEEATLLRVRSACDAYGAHVFAKVRIADVLPIEGSGISHALFTYALKAHFDFVIAGPDNEPLFVVEFDGPYHAGQRQAALDALKNGLCDTFALPILRIDARYLQNRYRDQSLLAWLVEVYFSKRNHEAAQRAGTVPPDEPFYAFNVFGLPQRDTFLPFRLGLNAERVIRKLYDVGKCASPYVPRLIGESRDGDYRAIGCVLLSANAVAYAEAYMRPQRFPVRLDDLLDEVFICKAERALLDTLKGKAPALLMGEFRRRAAEFLKLHGVWQASWVDPSTNNLTCPIRKAT